jgi:hypothetical protein
VIHFHSRECWWSGGKGRDAVRKDRKSGAADAELSVQSKDGMIIVNVNAVNAKNEPVPAQRPR